MAKSTCDQSCRLDMGYLKSLGFLSGIVWGTIGWKSNWDKTSATVLIDIHAGTIKLEYTIDAERVVSSIRIISTRCNYGGSRYWFICPLYKRGIFCGRKCHKLYLPYGAKYFGCRNCYELSYISRQNHNHRFEAFQKIFDVEEKLEKLNLKIKRKFYAGKPTRLYRKYLALSQWYENYSPDLYQSLGSLLRK